MATGRDAATAARDERREQLPSRKRLGAWYTPDEIALPLVRWALAGRTGPVLDPSFGGCSFLRAALIELAHLEAPQPGRQVVGVDVDHEGTAADAAALLAAGVPPAHLVYEDFLMVRRLPLGRFRAVVGNPPYVRHHWHELAWQRAAHARLDELALPLPRRASAWAYFVAHAATFVAPGGRLALVLPGAVLNAAYAAPVLHFVSERFRRVTLVRLMQRLFTADEESVVMLAEGLGEAGEPTVTYREVGDLDELAFDRSDRTVTVLRAAGYRFKQAALPEATAELFDRIVADPRITTLGAIARVRLGVVTGANEFFVRPADRVPRQPGVSARTVISRSRWLQSARWTEGDVRRRDREGERTRLLYVSSTTTLREPLRDEINAAVAKGFATRSHTGRRDPWYALTDRVTPDAFLPYMGAWPRGLAQNRARSLCTNAVHRVHWRDLGKEAAHGVVLGSWSTLFAFAAELFGRHYGGGILKLELADAQRLPVLTQPVDDASLASLDRQLRKHGPEGGRRHADHLLLKETLELTQAEIDRLRAGSRLLHHRRTR